MFVPVILGSDKTTVSVATGHSEYWPLYASIGNIHNNVRHAHGSGLVLVAFLAIPKSNCSISMPLSSLLTFTQQPKQKLTALSSASFGENCIMFPCPPY
jgi:Plavaka transposase